MPSLSYSPSSVSSSPSSLCSSAATDPALQMSTYFEDAQNPTEFYNSPVARINTKLLVPGYSGLNGSFHIPSFGACANKGLAPIPATFDYSAAQQATYGQFSISPEIIGETVNTSYQQVQ
jgi:hypothetical protein